jgi:histidyl-tRNA synthetase
MGQERIIMLLQRNGAVPVERPQVYLVMVGNEPQVRGFKLAEQLRDAWPALKLQVNLGGGGIKAQFRRADKSGADYALVLGDDELARGVVAVKPLRSEAGQEECPLDGISERLGVLLGLMCGSAE